MQRRLVIVGGGSAGWICAAYLHGALNERGDKNNVEITLIESPDIPRISVGEATVPSIHHVLDVIGVDEIDFMKATDATFKQSIKYVNWLHGKGEGYHHPFSRFTPGPIDRSGERWVKSKRDIPFIETVSAQAVISDIVLAPKPLDDRPFITPLKYAYHFDAQLFADYLRDISVQRGVKHILRNVISVIKDEEGYISYVKLDNGEEIVGDLFIDCTGFKGLLIEKEMGVDWLDFSQWLFCDKAVVAQYDYKTSFPGHIRPYTTATAQSAGWIWDTPTLTRRATGYVYSSKYIADEDARAELLAYQGVEDAETRIIRFKTGQREKAWTKNCISIGLSAGFIEPLESTGIFMSEVGAVLLAEHFPRRKDDYVDLARRYNRIISNRFYEILDFINMHYCLTQREDTPFWRDVQKPEHITDRLKAKLEFWSKKLPTASDFDDQSFGLHYYFPPKKDDPEIDPRPPVDSKGLWNHASYEAILYGMNFLGESEKGWVTNKPVTVQNFIIDTVRSAPQMLPPHHIWLHKKLGMTAWPVCDKPNGWI